MGAGRGVVSLLRPHSQSVEFCPAARCSRFKYRGRARPVVCRNVGGLKSAAQVNTSVQPNKASGIPSVFLSEVRA